jgi:hypothetical protein
VTPPTVGCRPDGDGWVCEVTVGEDAGATHHSVRVERGSLDRFGMPTADPASLVRAAFEFLLEHEARESILRNFELSEIGHYFPGWEGELRRRLSS